MIHSSRRFFGIILVFALIISCIGCAPRPISDYDFDRVVDEVETRDYNKIKGYAIKNNLCVLGPEDHGVYNQAHLDYICGIFDLNNKKTLYAQRLFEKLEPASLTKIMTAYLAIKYGNLDDMIVISDIVDLITDPGASSCDFKKGDKITLKNLLYAFLVHSGNECGNVIAEYISSSIEDFSDLMNKEAAKLGATHTHFTNPHGLSDENHYTTAYDLYLIFNEAIKNPTFLEMISTASYDCTYTDSSGQTITRTFSNTNRFLHHEFSTPEGIRVIGGKTGSTDQAGMCLILLSYDSNDNPYISIVMHATSRIQLYQAHQLLMYLI